MASIFTPYASASESGRFSAIAARIYRVYGRGSRDVISRWIRTALAGGTIRVYGPESRFDYVLADDVAEGLVRLGGTQEVGIVNLASGRARTIGEVLACIETQIAGVTIDGPYPAPEYESSEASLDRLTDILGWRPPTSLEHGIGELVAYERECIRTSTTSRRVLPPRRTNVMISSLSRKASIAEAVRAAYGALNIEGTIWGSDARSDPPALGHVDHLWHTAPLDKLTDDEIVSFCELEAIAVLIPTRDGELARFAGLRERLDDIGTFVPIGDPESVRIADDKLEFARVCSNAGLRAVPAATALDPSFGGRLVVKPRSGAGSKNSLIGIGREAAADALSANSDFVVQPYVTGVEYSVDIYIRRDGSCLGAVARERRDVVAGESIVTAVVDNAELRNLALECATAVGIRGHAVIQLIASGDGVQLLECNSRVGGASSAAWAAGLRSVDAMILESLGERPPDASPNTSLTVTRLPRDMLSWK
jgi:carbamoyl-phosphate synthase large subunit